MKDRERRNKSSDHLITVYLKIKKDEQEENERDRTDVWVRSFMRFCVVVYSFFIVDAVLPSRKIKDKIVDIQFSRTISGDGINTHDGYNHLMKGMTIITNHGFLTTLAVTGYEERGEKVLLGQSVLFSRIKYMYIGKYPYPVTHAINMYGWAIFMPILALLSSIYGGFFARKLGPVLFYGAANVLFFFPFIMLLFFV